MRIEVTQSNIGIVISQRKHALDILEKTRLMNSKSVETPMDPNVKLLTSKGEPLSDAEKYRIFTSRKNTFYDKIKRRSKRNHFKQKRGGNFEIKFNNTKAVTNKQPPSYLQLTRQNLIF